uniref:Succinate dehydrogenase assembly factor 3 n=1 Tax=Culicoides sonorensis TaxID=179676 RepID=A0A336M5K0_CULSO
MAQAHTQKVRFLYKTILRLHRGLPPELQLLGNEYTREEFKRHKNCSVTEAQTFMTTWADYAIDLSKQLGLKGKPGAKIGKPIDESFLEKLRDEQIVQLYELLKASKGLEENDDQIDVTSEKKTHIVKFEPSCKILKKNILPVQ